jgi:prevent-host-death family protein
MASISSTEANRRFSALLAKVRKGQATDITVRGVAVARLVPLSPLEVQKEESFKKHLEAIRMRPVLDLPRVTRDEMYDDE